MTATSHRRDELPLLDAHALLEMLRGGRLSARELMQASLARIERLNPIVNAIPTLREPEQLLADADAADRRRSRGEAGGPLEGLPVAVKDLSLTAGLRTTFGSLAYRDFVPAADELFVTRLKQAGAIILGKTNTPEFGAGSQTFNAVFGATRNPYDTGRTCGGSSGGAAVALACGMVPLADGSDLGGSLRNPAAFCNVVGFRPSPGRVPRLAGLDWDTLSVQGPMGRSVTDTALLLSVMAGPDPRDPISLETPGTVFRAPLAGAGRGLRIAWSENLGRYPVEPAVVDVCRRALPTFERLGCIVEPNAPDLGGAERIFRTLRAAAFAAKYRDVLTRARPLLKDAVVWNIEQGLALSALDVAEAEQARTALYRRVVAFFDACDFLVLPVSQVLPFPVEQEWVREIDGQPMQTYIDWMATCYAISCAGVPAISVPCGFSADGLPVGLQIVGPPQRDLDVLKLAYAFEQATGWTRRRPPALAVASGDGAAG